MGWVFGRQVRSKVHVLLSPPRGRYQVRSFFFLSFFLSLRLKIRGGLCPGVLYHLIHDNNVLSSDFTKVIEINLPMFSFRSKEGRRSTTLLSFSIYTHVLNLETAWWLSEYHVTCQSVCCAVPLTRSRQIAVEQNGRDNANNIDKSGSVVVKKFRRVFNKQLHFYPKVIKTK